MKQIIPFKKELLFKTKVSEVTSISLEHDFKIEDEAISGEFHISGDYKMTDGSINREKFNFDLPFDIALDSRYKMDSLVVDIDNFYYQIINNDTLQVNIDLFVDGEKIEEQPTVIENKEVEKDDGLRYEDLVEKLEEQEIEEEPFEDINYKEKERIESITDNEIVGENEVGESKNINNNININYEDKKKDFIIFDNVDNSETYKEYYVYMVKEDDTIDKILEKYNITKEEVSLYNDLENIKLGDKIIIPSKNE